MKTRTLLPCRGVLHAALLSGLVVATTQQAHAQAVVCSSLTNPVYVQGSTAVKPFLKAVAVELAKLATPITVVYTTQGGSCSGIGAMTTSPSSGIVGSPIYWDTTGSADLSCTADLTPQAVDIGVSDVFASSCTTTALASDVLDYFGPIQAMTFAVPFSSTNASISAEAAYLVYGLGAAGAVPNWTDETLIFQRSATSGTQAMLAAAIKVPAAKWKGVTNTGSGGVVTNLVNAATAGNQNKAIGILGIDTIQSATNRTLVKPLAYKHYGQSCGYYPDSTVSAFDKANVRDGHYQVFGPLHMLAHSTSGEPTNPNAKTVIRLLDGTNDITGLDLIKTEATSGVVPGCAMAVKRTTEMGPLQDSNRTKMCDCKFEAEATGVTPAGCVACSAGTPCTGGKVCNYGFCEVK